MALQPLTPTTVENGVCPNDQPGEKDSNLANGNVNDIIPDNPSSPENKDIHVPKVERHSDDHRGEAINHIQTSGETSENMNNST